MSTSVLMYHSLDDSGSPISVAPAVFARQMQMLNERGAKVIPLKQLVEGLTNRTAIPDRSVVLTFDDGFENVYQHAFPLLQRYGFPATVFAVADYCGKTNDWPSQPAGIPRLPIMSWEQIQEMDRHGIEIAAHTCTHPRLDQVSGDELEREVVHSKEVIEGQLGHRVDHFSYPYGRFDATSAQLVGQTYAGACTTKLGVASAKSSPMALERVDSYYVRQPQIFKTLSSPVLSTYLAMRRPLRSVGSLVLGRQWG